MYTTLDVMYIMHTEVGTVTTKSELLSFITEFQSSQTMALLVDIMIKGTYRDDTRDAAARVLAGECARAV